jgi:hypothetical protein
MLGRRLDAARRWLWRPAALPFGRSFAGASSPTASALLPADAPPAVQAVGPHPPGAPLIARRSAPLQRPVVLMIALGMDGGMLEKLLAQTRPLDVSEPEPVFLIDHADFTSLTKHGVLFEHFPSSSSRAMLGADLPWSRYAERRLDLLAAKWRPVSIVPFGKRSHDLLANWRERQQG